METIAGYADSYDITTTSFFASPAESSIVYPPPENPNVTALQLLSNSLEAVFDSPEAFYSDAKLVLSSGRELSFHRCVVSARSPFLKTSLASSSAVSGVVRLEMKDIAKEYEVGYDSVSTVLAYLYSGRVRPPPKGVSDCADESCSHSACRPAVDFMVEVLYLAFLFEVPELVALYERQLFNAVDKVVIEDALVILKLASICGEACVKLLERCREIVVNSDLDLVTLEKSLPEDIVKEIVGMGKELGFEFPEVNKHVSKIHKALNSDDIELVELLLSEGHASLDDACALHFAVAYCNVKTATDLLEMGLADVNLRNFRGYTVLHVAAMRKEPNLILSLLKNGASTSMTSLEGRTALSIAKQVTKAAELNNNPENSKGRLCVEMLEDAAKRDPIPGDLSPSFEMDVHELKMSLLYLENRVALAQRIFPMAAQSAMDIAQVKGTCEFVVTSHESDPITGAKRTSPDRKITPAEILEKYQSRLKALSKTVELGKGFFPRCSEYLDQLMDSEDLTQLACEEDTPEKRLQKKQRYMEIQETVLKAFTQDKEERGKSSLSASSSTSKSAARKKRPNGKLSRGR